MITTNRKKPTRIAAGCLLLIAATCLQLPVLAQVAGNFGTTYGLGVEAYLAGNYHRAERLLSRAITIGPEDPRPYYFRGLTRMNMGRHPDARQDMKLGAMIEARRPEAFDIGTALERVQGGARLTLEEIRRQARSETTRSAPTTDRPLAGHRQRNVIRSKEFKAREAAALRRPANLPLDILADTVELSDAVTLATSGRLETARSV